MHKLIAASLTACVLFSAPAEAKKRPEISALALQQIQARDYEVKKEISFPSVMTVLQDSGYRISAADKDTGLITATASTKSKLTWVPFVGFGRSKKSPVISAYVEDRGAGSRIRLSFVMAKVKSNAYGTSLSDEEPIIDPATYRDAFERIEKEIFVRQALNAPALLQPTAPVSQQIIAPASAPQVTAPVAAPQVTPAAPDATPTSESTVPASQPEPDVATNPQ